MAKRAGKDRADMRAAAASGPGRRPRAATPRREISRIRPGQPLTGKQIDVLTTALTSLRSRLGFECGSGICICTGDRDCNDLFSTGLCGDGICFETADGGVVCLCVRAASR